MNVKILSWGPAAILALGALLTVGIDGQRRMDLRAPLDVSVPVQISGQRARNIEVSKAERRVAGMSSYVMRVYSPSGDLTDLTPGNFSVYVGYYAEQMRGRTIHSPKNCLPGSGWEALTSRVVVIQTPDGPVKVNQYMLQRRQQRALVLYWYQGRGRIESNEYRVKLNLLKDAVFMRRSDEALVRIVVPLQSSDAKALERATGVAAVLVPAVTRSLPEG